MPLSLLNQCPYTRRGKVESNPGILIHIKREIYGEEDAGGTPLFWINSWVSSYKEAETWVSLGRVVAGTGYPQVTGLLGSNFEPSALLRVFEMP